jgi:hypothetical protein
LFGSTLTFNAIGIDADVPVQTLTYSLTGEVPEGVAIDPATGAFSWAPGVSQVGAAYTFNVRVTDSDDVFAQQSVVVGVAYEWSNFLAPLNNSGTSFNLNETIPVKFKLTGASANIGNAKAYLLIAPVVGGIVGTESPATAVGSLNSGNLFRYDAAEKQYIFNFSTRNLKAGTYQLRVDLGDGVSRTLRIKLE